MAHISSLGDGFEAKPLGFFLLYDWLTRSCLLFELFSMNIVVSQDLVWFVFNIRDVGWLYILIEFLLFCNVIVWKMFHLNSFCYYVLIKCISQQINVSMIVYFLYFHIFCHNFFISYWHYEMSYLTWISWINVFHGLMSSSMNYVYPWIHERIFFFLLIWFVSMISWDDRNPCVMESRMYCLIFWTYYTF